MKGINYCASANYSLPACTTANGCFRKVDENGGTGYPTGDSGWAAEISLDLDMVSAIYLQPVVPVHRRTRVRRPDRPSAHRTGTPRSPRPDWVP